MNAQEEAIIRWFIRATRRTRWLESLASAKRRPRMLDRLNHCLDIDERYATALPSSADVVELLRSHGAKKLCYVLSCTEALDGKTVPVEDAVSATALSGWGTIISCIPGRLAYYYDECGERRMLLVRAVTQRAGK